MWNWQDRWGKSGITGRKVIQWFCLCDNHSQQYHLHVPAMTCIVTHVIPSPGYWCFATEVRESSIVALFTVGSRKVKCNVLHRREQNVCRNFNTPCAYKAENSFVWFKLTRFCGYLKNEITLLEDILSLICFFDIIKIQNKNLSKLRLKFHNEYWILWKRNC